MTTATPRTLTTTRLRRLGLKHLRIKPGWPRTKGKAETHPDAAQRSGVRAHLRQLDGNAPQHSPPTSTATTTDDHTAASATRAVNHGLRCGCLAGRHLPLLNRDYFRPRRVGCHVCNAGCKFLRSAFQAQWGRVGNDHALERRALSPRLAAEACERGSRARRGRRSGIVGILVDKRLAEVADGIDDA